MSQNKSIKAAIPEPEVVPQAERRQFTAKYKLRILEKADSCNGAGELGALLRREGLYSSYLSRWRRQRDQGQLQALASKKRGRKNATQDQRAEELVELRRENRRLQLRLEQAETIIEIQKKLSHLLGLTASETGKGASR
jgi:transposase-like protein